MKILQVPAIMIPITCANTASSSPVFPSSMPLVNMMMPGTATTGFIPLCMGEPVMYNMGGGLDQGGESPRGPRSAPRPARAQFELPNCLAVNSCMTQQEQSGTVKKTGTKRSPLSGEGSRHTSIKGESGSALDSNNSRGEPIKTKALLLDPSSAKPKHEQEICSSSQSLYSFLHSSDENEVTDYLQAESSKPDDSEGDDKVRSIRQVARPVLSEPFWNEGVVLSETLMKTYQMEERDIEAVLKRDLERLEQMKQSEVVNNQLKVSTNIIVHVFEILNLNLFQELQGFMEVVEEFAFQNVFVDNEENDDDEDVTDTTSGDDGEKDDSFTRKKKLNRLRNLEKLNMFMEENAPFPENLLSPLKVSESATVHNPSYAKGDLKGDSSPDENFHNPSSIVEAFKMTVGKAGTSTSRNRTPDTNEMFTSSRPQETRFQYGKGMETNTITQADTNEEKEKDSKKQNESAGNTTDTTSSDEILKTSSSAKSSSPPDQKRKKGLSSPESNSSALIQDDKKLRYETDSSENKMGDSTDSEGANTKKE